MWHDSWSDLIRVALAGATAYAVLVVVLRTTGKRSLAKLNAFDLVVTVAIGSTLATVVLSSDISLTEGALALALLPLLQLVVTWISAHRPGTRKVITSAPTLVLRNGEPTSAMVDQRLTMDELRQAIRSTGTGDVADVAAVVLETDGTLSVIPTGKLGDGSALHGTADS